MKTTFGMELTDPKVINPSPTGSSKWVKDINKMHDKYGVHDWMINATPEQKREFLKFRIAFLREELGETELAFYNDDPEEITDGLIDLCVIAIGTLDAFGVDADRAWNAVHQANMAKEIGVKESRPNPLGLPDLVKPDGWVAPSHQGNGVTYGGSH